MKKTIFVILIFISVSTQAQQENCERVTNFGLAQLCLAHVSGYKECYLEPNIKQLADMTEVPVNMVLGFI